jgi:hypothetical protein
MRPYLSRAVLDRIMIAASKIIDDDYMSLIPVLILISDRDTDYSPEALLFCIPRPPKALLVKGFED